jgi:hypothetical protein
VNYTELFSTIKAYVESDFPSTSFTDTDNSSTVTVTSSDQINTFITQAEQRIFNQVQFPSLRKNVVGTTTTGNKYLACPDDFLAPYSIAVVDTDGEYHFLLNKDVNFIREAYPNPLDIALPEYYALFGPRTLEPDELTFILGPTPDDDYTVELHYFFYPESITVSATGTSWLGDNIDSVLLYGSLVEAYTFLKGEADLVAAYNSKYMEALALAKRLGDGMERRDAYRSGQYRQAVT